MFPYHQDHKTIRHEAGPRVGLLWRGGGRRTVLRCGKIDVMCLQIHRQRARALLSLDCFHDTEFVRGIFAHYSKRAIAIGTEREAGAGIKGRPVRVLADRQIRDDAPVVSVHHDHLLITAYAEQPPIFHIHRQPARLFARRERPALNDGALTGINHRHFALVVEIDEDLPFAIRHGELGTSAERDGADYFAARGVYYRRGGVGGGACAIERENVARRRIIKNRVRIPAGFRLADGLERFEIEDRHRRIPAVAGEAAIQPRRERDTMYAVGAGNLADDFVFVHINHYHLGRVRDVEPARRAIHREIIPAAGAADRDFLNHLMASRRRLRNSEGIRQEQEKTDGNQAQSNNFHLGPPNGW